MSTKLFPRTVRCIDCLHYNDKRKPFGCKYSGARVSLKAAKTRDIICDYYIDEKATVAAARAGWRGHAAGVYGKRGKSHAKVFQVDYQKYRLQPERRMLSKGNEGDFWVSGYDVLKGQETVGFVWKESRDGSSDNIYWRAISWRYLGVGKGYRNTLAVTVFRTREDATRWVAREGK